MKDPTKYNEKGQLKSAIDADKKRDENKDSIRLRVPKGMRDKIQAHVSNLSSSYQKRGKGNVNQWLCDLIQKELDNPTLQ